MAQGSSGRTVKIGDQPVEVETLSEKELLLYILLALTELRDMKELELSSTDIG